jgi:hypothetical protein
VEAFVNERDANQLSIGQPVEITLPEIKLDPGEDELRPLGLVQAELRWGNSLYNHHPKSRAVSSPVRVVTVRIAVDWQKSLTRSEFCGAGLSVQVRFIN